jgi:hypothetical protein
MRTPVAQDFCLATGHLMNEKPSLYLVLPVTLSLATPVASGHRQLPYDEAATAATGLGSLFHRHRLWLELDRFNPFDSITNDIAPRVKVLTASRAWSSTPGTAHGSRNHPHQLLRQLLIEPIDRTFQLRSQAAHPMISAPDENKNHG